MAGAYDIAIAGGVESMTRVDGRDHAAGSRTSFGPKMLARYAHGLVPQGISAEMIAEKWGSSRQRLDGIARFAHASDTGDRRGTLRWSGSSQWTLRMA